VVDPNYTIVAKFPKKYLPYYLKTVEELLGHKSGA